MRSVGTYRYLDRLNKDHIYLLHDWIVRQHTHRLGSLYPRLYVVVKLTTYLNLLRYQVCQLPNILNWVVNSSFAVTCRKTASLEVGTIHMHIHACCRTLVENFHVARIRFLDSFQPFQATVHACWFHVNKKTSNTQMWPSWRRAIREDSSVARSARTSSSSSHARTPISSR
jgi:hypothetical protein